MAPGLLYRGDMRLDAIETGAVVACGAGVCIGAATIAGVGALYPPARDHLWPIGSVATASIVVVLVLYLTSARLDVRRAGDCLIVGYATALVIAAMVVVTHEMVQMVRDRVPESIGVKTGAVEIVQWRG